MSDHTGVERGEGQGAASRLWGSEETIQRGWIIIHEPNRCPDLHIPTPQSERGLDAALETLTKLRPSGTVLTVARLTWNGDLWIEDGAARLAENAVYDSFTPEDWAQINGRYENESEAEETAPCDEPPSGRDRNGLGGDSPAGAVAEGQAPDQISALKAENERLRELLADRTAERDAARRAHQQARAALAESERKRVEKIAALLWLRDYPGDSVRMFQFLEEAERREYEIEAQELLRRASLAATPTQETSHVES